MKNNKHTLEEVKEDIEAYCGKPQRKHVELFINIYKDRADEDGISLMGMYLPTHLVFIHSEKGILTNSSDIDNIDDLSKIKTHCCVARTVQAIGGVKKENYNDIYECEQKGYHFSLGQVYDTLRLEKAKGYDIFCIYDYGVMTEMGDDSKIDDPWLYIRFSKVMSDLKIETLEEEIREKWKKTA